VLDFSNQGFEAARPRLPGGVRNLLLLLVVMVVIAMM
jgi:hypothetical protein